MADAELLPLPRAAMPMLFHSTPPLPGDRPLHPHGELPFPPELDPPPPNPPLPEPADEWHVPDGPVVWH